MSTRTDRVELFDGQEKQVGGVVVKLVGVGSGETVVDVTWDDQMRPIDLLHPQGFMIDGQAGRDHGGNFRPSPSDR